MNIGVIGTGNMGTLLVDAFVEAHAVNPSCFTIINRTATKALHLKEKHPSIHIAASIKELIIRSDFILICVKPLEIYPILHQYADLFTKEKCLVSITSPVNVEQLQSVVATNVARVIPSITNRALSGISLCTFGHSCSEHWRAIIYTLFQSISTPVEIEEEVTRVASDIVSCGPAFFSYLLQQFIHAAVCETKITHEQATELASGMLIGMGTLLEKNHFSLPSLQQQVCVKGGITGEGIQIMENELGDMFNHLFQRTQTKYEEDKLEIQKQFKKS